MFKKLVGPLVGVVMFAILATLFLASFNRLPDVVTKETSVFVGNSILVETYLINGTPLIKVNEEQFNARKGNVYITGKYLGINVELNLYKKTDDGVLYLEKTAAAPTVDFFYLAGKHYYDLKKVEYSDEYIHLSWFFEAKKDAYQVFWWLGILLLSFVSGLATYATINPFNKKNKHISL